MSIWRRHEFSLVTVCNFNLWKIQEHVVSIGSGGIVFVVPVNPIQIRRKAGNRNFSHNEQCYQWPSSGCFGALLSRRMLLWKSVVRASYVVWQEEFLCLCHRLLEIYFTGFGLVKICCSFWAPPFWGMMFGLGINYLSFNVSIFLGWLVLKEATMHDYEYTIIFHKTATSCGPNSLITFPFPISLLLE